MMWVKMFVICEVRRGKSEKNQKNNQKKIKKKIKRK